MYLKNMDTKKSAGLDSLYFLRDGAEILAKEITQICGLSIKYSLFSIDFQSVKLNQLFKIVLNTVPGPTTKGNSLKLKWKFFSNIRNFKRKRGWD